MKIRTLIALSLLAITGTVATASPPASSYMPASGTHVAERISSISLPGAGIVNHRSADLGKTLLPVGNAQGTSASAPKLLPEPGRNAISRVSLSGAKMYTWMGMTDTESGGWYRFDTDGAYKPVWTNILSKYGINLTNGWIRNGRLCGLGVFDMGGLVAYYNYVEMDLNTGELLEEISVGPDNTIDFGLYYISCAYVPEEDRIYGYTQTTDQSGYRFCSSPADNIGDVTVIRDLDYSGDRANSFCYNPADDSFYGVTFSGNFVKVDREGTQTFLFDPGLEYLKNSKCALTYSPYDGCLIYTPMYYGYASQLFYVYPEKKTMRFVRNFPTDNQFFFLIDQSYEYDPQLPGRPDILEESFAPGALSGSLRVRMPSKTGSGAALRGNLTWHMYVDNVETLSGSAAPGAEVQIPVNSLEQGERVIRVSCSAGNGDGLPCVVNRFFGNGIPLAPENVTLTETTVSWDAVTEAVLDGYLEKDKMRYDVYINDRFMGSTDATSMNIQLDSQAETQAYYAYVAATCNSQVSERTQSNKLIFGSPFTLPYTVVPTQEQADIMRIFNLDGSPQYGTWEFYETRWHEPVFASGWSNEQADDWLILPAVDCSDLTHAYRVTLDAICGGHTGMDERFEVWCGNAPTPDAMNTLIIPETSISKYITEGWETFSNIFVPKEAGPTYIAIRAVSPPGQYSLIVRKIRIEATDELADVPLAPTDLEVTGVSDADLSVTIRFKVPTSTIAGNEIPAGADLKVKAGTGEKWKEQEAAPGQTVTMTVDTYQGVNRIEAYCVLNGQSGQSVTTSLFTGTIPPNFVNNFKCELSRDNLSMHLTWDPPTEGQENLEGYYSPEGMHYWLFEVVTDPEFGESTWEPTLDLGNVNEYTYELPEGERLQYKYLGIAAANAGGISRALWHTCKQIGHPYTPEIEENFDGGREPALHYGPVRMTSPTDMHNGMWSFCLPEDLGDDHWNPEIPYAMIAFTENETGGKARLELPKVTTENVRNPGLSLLVWTTEPVGPISIYADTYGSDGFERIYTIPLIDDGWQWVVIPMPEKYLSMPWIQLGIDADLADPYTYSLIGGYKFGEVDPGAVEIMAAEGPGVIFGGKSEIVVVGMEGAATSVWSADGRLVARKSSVGATERIKAASGIYTVRCGETVRKVIVR